VLAIDSEHLRAIVQTERAERNPHARVHPAPRRADRFPERRCHPDRVEPFGGTLRLQQFLTRNAFPTSASTSSATRQRKRCSIAFM